MIPWFIYFNDTIKLSNIFSSSLERPNTITLRSKGIQSVRMDTLLTAMVF